ncbi:GNAT family N-acetyltransferase [Halobacillus litoralis]|uniref:GNAT family N-acetyltransferase n=1 Tax=Halobacillus litoralis TaxID=45668 RepID=UPI001CFE525E|nr:GNAT family N-acetyltransferase [Halobacillus litoralis]
MQTLKGVKIVEYHEGLAKSIADMWNESRSEWGGDAVVTTEQEVKEKEGKSTNLHLFLALIEDRVVGYCGLSEYREDTGSLYIPLLNVHPDYHGKKIGRALLLKAIEKTVEYGWPRLDLFTWPGNTKAVPLYKKCGFFWEERDDTTHLMNFMPLVLQIEWLRPFFERNDWYESSQRPVEIKPDGVKENDHTFYEYKWTAGDEFVRIQIERTGRGIRLIETENLLIEMSLPQFKLLENEEHSVCYRVVNKTVTPVRINVHGSSSSLIKHDFVEELEVEKEWEGELPLHVSVPAREPSPWKTHPVVEADFTIDGNTIPFKTGVFPIYAGKINLRTVHNSWRKNQQGTVYLDLESSLDESSRWTIQLPKQEVLDWGNSAVKAEVGKKERLSIPVPVTLKKNDFLSEDIEVCVEFENREPLTFKAPLRLAFPGYGGKFGGETQNYWYGYNGPYFIEIEKRNHFIKAGSIRSKEDPVTIMTPHLGKPFSQEFSKKEASSVEYIHLAEALVLKTTLESEAFPSVLLNTYIKVYGDGLVEMHHELINRGEAKTDMHLLLPVFPMYKQMALPFKDGVAVGTEALIPYTEYIRDQDISEPWLYTSNSWGDTKALGWPENAVGKKNDWRFSIEYSLGKLPAHEKRCLGPVQIGINAVSNWRDWRDLVVGEGGRELKERPLYALEASDGSFISCVGEQVVYTFRSLLTPYVHGSLTVNVEEETFVKEAVREDSKTEINIKMTHQTPGIKEIKGRFRSSGQEAELHTLQLVQSHQGIKVTEEEGHWTVNNGILSFSADAAYYPGVYSLMYENREALHHQYPEAGARSWWNPWGGGLRYALPDVSAFSMLKEHTNVTAVERIDTLGQRWTGLCVTTTITKHEKMKGVTLKQYTLTLPGVPVVALYAEIDQGANRAFTNEKLLFEAFFKPGEELSSCYAHVPKPGGVFHTYYAGVEEYELENTPAVLIGSDERREKLTYLYPSVKKEAGCYMNQDVYFIETIQQWQAAYKDTASVAPTFLYYGEEDLPQAHHLFHGLSFQAENV